MSPQLSLVGQAGWGEPVPEVSRHRGLSSLGGDVLPASPASHPGQPSSAGDAGELQTALIQVHQP